MAIGYGIAGSILVAATIVCVTFGRSAEKQAALQETAPKSAEYSTLEFKTAFEDYVNAQTELGYYCGAVTQITCPDKTTSLERSKCIELNIKFDLAVKRAGDAGKKLEEITGTYFTVEMPNCLNLK